MYLVQIFRASPLMGLALCICMATIFWCFLIAKRQLGGLDKILTGILGFISVYEAVRIMKDSGVILIPGFRQLNGWADFLVASIYLVAALMLKLSSADRVTTKFKLRLVEANEQRLEVGKSVPASGQDVAALLDASPLATFAVDASGAVLYWNPAAERLLGWKSEEVVGQKLPAAVVNGTLHNRQGQSIDAAVWTVPFGAAQGTLTIAAGRSILPETAPAGDLALHG